MISVLILTRNEEVNLPGCLDSVAWSDDVVVFDSFSTDRTCDIARNRGARVFQHAFEDYGSQREAARTLVDFRHPWLLVLDADERVDDRLAQELAEVANGPLDHLAYAIRHKHFFQDRWIRRSSLYPTWGVRLIHHQSVRYEHRSVHEGVIVPGSIGRLEGHLLHYSFNKGLEPWLAKHNTYSTLEARENLRALEEGRKDGAGILSRDPVRRRRALKLLSMRLPFRACQRFLYMYLLRGGFLDGVPGLRYCALLAFYELSITIKLQELRRERARQLPPPSEVTPPPAEDAGRGERDA